MSAPGVGLADASTLGVSCLNVGMLQENAFGKRQQQKVQELAGSVQRWLIEGDGPAVVGLNEIHPSIADKVEDELHMLGLGVQKATNDSDALFWRPPR